MNELWEAFMAGGLLGIVLTIILGASSKSRDNHYQQGHQPTLPKGVSRGKPPSSGSIVQRPK